jgi:8-oxo-dGTP diphosphatase
MSSSMIMYVCGFIITSDFEKVTLIKKIKPDWEKDKLNGICGKVEKKEYPLQAMMRETKEETGIDTNQFDWLCGGLGMEEGYDWRCFFFCCINDTIPKTMEAEEVAQYNISDIDTLPVIPNLKQLIPKAVELLKQKKNG